MTEATSSFRYRSAAATHPGAVRALNEDAFLDHAEAGIWAVADGVGGHDAGDYASAVVVAALGRIGPQASAAELLAAARDRLDATNANLLAFAANEGVEIVATTVAVLLCFGEHYAALWAGDSRIYRWRAGMLDAVTRDHTAVQEMVDAGAITAAEARSHPQGNIVTRAVGAGPELALDMAYDLVLPDDRFLLCSDGLTKVLADEEIGAALAIPDLDRVPGVLIDEVLARGAPDNVTIVAVACTLADG